MAVSTGRSDVQTLLPAFPAIVETLSQRHDYIQEELFIDNHSHRYCTFLM